MGIDTLEKERGVRAESYRMLSECYKEPCIEFATDVAYGHLYQGISSLLARLGIAISLEDLKMPGEATEVLQTLKEEYYPLFVGPFPPFALPVESVYKEWAREGETPLITSGIKGMVMGDPAIDMLRRYKAAGIEIPLQYKETPDHLSLLLEYMALLCEIGTEKEQREFVENHLDWVPEFKKLIYACSESRFYRTVGNATTAFVANERSILGKTEKYHDPLDQTVKSP